MTTEYYRHPSSSQEVKDTKDEHKIETRNPQSTETWFTTTKYDDPDDAKEELALSTKPDYRLGPIEDTRMPSFKKGPRTVQPANGEPGGGVEVCVDEPIWVFGIEDMQNNNWEEFM